MCQSSGLLFFKSQMLQDHVPFSSSFRNHSQQKPPRVLCLSSVQNLSINRIMFCLYPPKIETFQDDVLLPSLKNTAYITYVWLVCSAPPKKKPLMLVFCLSYVQK